ncbi:UPF0481 protein At3g47200-like [Actinidia eriantha]|uniref:UPF0481 protein At3g47200-like n=1 Tax=Actinidia eriantha TaxID=165200 RepID=UPI00258CC026|nr:UPF0481 protein At3g47200-like [Actinidia eriantha]
MSQQNDYCKQALQSLTTTIDRKISEGAQKIKESFPSACIYRVPEKLRKLKESAYTPDLVSIGPLHSKDKHLKSLMQDIKMSYVNSLLYRTIDGSEGSEVCRSAVLEECVEEMKLSVKDAKKCYTEEVDNLNEEMLVVDGCFILELLYRYYLLTHPKEETNEEINEITKEMPKEKIIDPVFDNNLMSITVQQDLLLLENQLPFCVLEKLFHVTVDKIPGRPPNYSLFHYVVSYFSNVTTSLEHKSTTSNETNCCSPNECLISLFGNRMKFENEGGATPKKYYHILHIVHDHYFPLDPPKGEYHRELMPSASYLDYARVKFVAGTGKHLFKVKFTDQSCLERGFQRARFEIPTLSLYDSTERFLRNLIAFEQCCPGVSFFVTSYAFLMDMLVKSAKDVEVLQMAGIIQNHLGADQDASNLFNKLCKEVVLEKFFFVETCNQATKYSKRYWPATVAHVRRKYLATRWAFIAFCVAFIAFGMSITQFVRNVFKWC